MGTFTRFSKAWAASIGILAAAIILSSPELASAAAQTDLKGLKLLQVVPPEYPAIARRYNIHGVVTVQMLVRARGAGARIRAYWENGENQSIAGA